jgi:hypothetical protein
MGRNLHWSVIAAKGSAPRGVTAPAGCQKPRLVRNVMAVAGYQREVARLVRCVQTGRAPALRQKSSPATFASEARCAREPGGLNSRVSGMILIRIPDQQNPSEWWLF